MPVRVLIASQDAKTGFTLIKLMVVVAIIAIANAVTGFNAFSRLESPMRKDAERLVQLFDVAQSEARAGGRSFHWERIRRATGSFAALPRRRAAPIRRCVKRSKTASRKTTCCVRASGMPAT